MEDVKVTWKQFKEEVEKQEVKDNDVITYIDFDVDSEFPKVERYESGAIRITAGDSRYKENQ